MQTARPKQQQQQRRQQQEEERRDGVAAPSFTVLADLEALEREEASRKRQAAQHTNTHTTATANITNSSSSTNPATRTTAAAAASEEEEEDVSPTTTATTTTTAAAAATTPATQEYSYATLYPVVHADGSSYPLLITTPAKEAHVDMAEWEVLDDDEAEGKDAPDGGVSWWDLAAHFGSKLVVTATTYTPSLEDTKSVLGTAGSYVWEGSVATCSWVSDAVGMYYTGSDGVAKKKVDLTDDADDLPQSLPLTLDGVYLKLCTLAENNKAAPAFEHMVHNAVESCKTAIFFLLPDPEARAIHQACDVPLQTLYPREDTQHDQAFLQWNARILRDLSACLAGMQATPQVLSVFREATQQINQAYSRLPIFQARNQLVALVEKAEGSNGAPMEHSAKQVIQAALMFCKLRTENKALGFPPQRDQLSRFLTSQFANVTMQLENMLMTAPFHCCGPQIRSAIADPSSAASRALFCGPLLCEPLRQQGIIAADKPADRFHLALFNRYFVHRVSMLVPLGCRLAKTLSELEDLLTTCAFEARSLSSQQQQLTPGVSPFAPLYVTSAAPSAPPPPL